MRFSTVSVVALMAMGATAKDSRTYAINYFYGNGPLTVGRMDPIVSPGKASGHHHTIMGGSNFGLTMTDTQLLSSTCTNANARDDKSNYWVPSLFFQDPTDGTFTPVPMFYAKVYYFFEATDDPIKAFQPGHRMLIGNSTLRTPPAMGGASVLDPAQGPLNPVQWICPRQNQNTPLYEPNSDGMHGVGMQDPGNAGAGAGFPDKECDGFASPLRSDVHFPSCWNPQAGLDDYENNMQFPSTKYSTDNKANCPPGWVHTPHLFMEVYWNTPLFQSKWTQGQGNQPFVLANGDPTGYSLHADFISGWDPVVLQNIIDNCNAADGGIQECPGLPGGVNDPSTSCNIPAAIPDNFVIDESLTVKLATLPGNNPIVGYGGVPASSPATGSAVSPSQSAASSMATSAVAPASSSSNPAQNPSATQSAAAQKAVNPPTTQSSAGAQQVAPINPPTASVSSPAAGLDGPVQAIATPSAPASPSESGAASSTGNSPPASSAAASTVKAGWAAYGCYSDIYNSRVLNGITFADIGQHAVTNTNCVAYCDGKGYSMAGTEFGGQCFCGNTMVGSSQLADSQCNMPCEGDATQTCGGSLSLTVFKKGSIPACRKKRHLANHADKHLARGETQFVARPFRV